MRVGDCSPLNEIKKVLIEARILVSYQRKALQRMLLRYDILGGRGKGR